MSQSQLSHRCIYRQGLDIARVIGTGRRVADVADTDRPPFFFRYAVGKDRADEPHAAVGMDILAVSQGNAAAFLAAVLQGKEPPIYVAGNIKVFIKNP